MSELKGCQAGANGQPVELLTLNGRTVEVDVEVALLVRALNDAGLETVASCSGHGFRPADIVLRDGREVIIARNFDEARRINALFPLDINGEPASLQTEPEEVTPEMVEVGIRAWMYCESTRTADILRATYLAMRSATSVESSGGTLNETDSSFNPAEDYCGIVEVDETDFRDDEPVAKDGR